MLLSTWLEGARGRGAALARHLRIPASMVARMASGGKQVPLEHCPHIQEFTGGAVTCEELRPDQVAHFALIRAQGNALVDPAADRRDPLRINPFPDLGRRHDDVGSVLAGEG